VDGWPVVDGLDPDDVVGGHLVVTGEWVNDDAAGDVLSVVARRVAPEHANAVPAGGGTAFVVVVGWVVSCLPPERRGDGSAG
jgi:hypothetical protein